MRYRPQFRLWQLLFVTTAVCIMCAFPRTIGLPLVMCVVLMIFVAVALVLNIGIFYFVFAVAVAIRNGARSIVQMVHH